jgi:hypothetical protein
MQLAVALKYTYQFVTSQTHQHINMVCSLLLMSLFDYVKCVLPLVGFVGP